VQFLGQFQAGEVLVTDKTDPDWEPIMKKAAAIITNRGGRTCHAAIVSRELGVPAIVGTDHGTDLLKDGQLVTVSCAEGDTGFVYEGRLPFEVASHEPRAAGVIRRTKVMMNVGNPEEAFTPIVHPERRRRTGPHGVYHLQHHQDSPARAAQLRESPGPRGAAADRRAHEVGYEDKPGFTSWTSSPRAWAQSPPLFTRRT
jgi:phosphohistidine swiveling domain-containing protein